MYKWEKILERKEKILRSGRNVRKIWKYIRRMVYGASLRIINRGWSSFDGHSPGIGPERAGVWMVWGSSNRTPPFYRDGPDQKSIEDDQQTPNSAPIVSLPRPLVFRPQAATPTTLSCCDSPVCSRDGYRPSGLDTHFCDLPSCNGNFSIRQRWTLPRRRLTRERESRLKEGDGQGFAWMLGEGGFHGHGRSRGIPVHWFLRIPQGSFQEFQPCLPVDTMHKSESCILLFLRAHPRTRAPNNHQLLSIKLLRYGKSNY